MRDKFESCLPAKFWTKLTRKDSITSDAYPEQCLVLTVPTPKHITIDNNCAAKEGTERCESSWWVYLCVEALQRISGGRICDNSVTTVMKKFLSVVARVYFSTV